VEAAEGEGFVRVLLGEPGTALAERLGELPLPPYMERPADEEDARRYQTLFARPGQDGSVAAPTAGLHFSEQVLAASSERGVARATVTLHVGPGTFLPVRSESLEEHVMHAERYWLPPDTADAILRTKQAGGRVIAVGTTSTRVLESVAPIQAGQGSTRLFIRPGFTFGTVDVLLTNFHLPRSTLFVLVCAFAGRDLMLEAYQRAIEAGYRFYSYGDAMLIL